MLVEVHNVRQIPGEGFRRWFSDDYFDLIVWHDDVGLMSGFQLCYDKTGYERVLTWRRGHGYAHDRIDDGETPGEPKRTPILALDGVFEKKQVALAFRNASATCFFSNTPSVHETIRRYA